MSESVAKRKARSAASQAYQVGPEAVVQLAYSVYDADGELVASAEPEHQFVFGFGQLLPRLEQALEGALPGDRREVVLAPGDAFGPRDAGAIIEVDRADFPADIAPGDDFEAENAEGSLLVLRVLEVHDDSVVLDTNHPLAGQKVRFELEVRAVRPATASELSQAAERLERSEPQPGDQLLAPERLLQGRERRYDSPPSPAEDPTGEKPA